MEIEITQVQFSQWG